MQHIPLARKNVLVECITNVHDNEQGNEGDISMV